MHSPVILALKYISYYLKAANGKGHGVHSPFVFDFIRNVLNDKTKYASCEEVERFRRRLLNNNTPVPIEDYGAGSSTARSNSTTVGSRSVAAITVNTAKSPKYTRLLFRIARYYRPKYMLELGTSFGISAASLALADQHAMLLTGEGNYAVASMARDHFLSLGLPNIRVVTGNFDNTLPEMVTSVPQVDLAFIDGNHRQEPTLRYFNTLLPRMSPASIIIFDDIHWSRGMEAAWEKIKSHPSVLLTIDLFVFGLVIFRPEFKVKQDFSIRF